MGREVKKLWAFSRLDYKAAEQYLQKQAAKGYILKEINQFSLLWATYEKTEPKEIHYCIDGLSGDKAARQEYIDFAADGGWHLVCQMSGQVVFASEEGKNPPPVQTDWENEYRQMRKSLWKLDIPMGIFIGIFFWFMLKFHLWSFDASLTAVESIGEILFDILALSVFIVFLRAIWFYIRSEIAIRQGKPLKPSGLRTGRFWAVMHINYGIGILLVIASNFARGIEDQIERADFLSYSIIGVLAVMIVLAGFKSRIGEERRKELAVGLGILGLFLLLVQCSMGADF